jgi:midasin
MKWFRRLSINSTTGKMHFTSLYSTPENCVNSGSAYKTVKCIFPVVELIDSLLNHFIKQSFTIHRATCKLRYVLLGLFTDLMARGFCAPVEEETTAEGEGATEFEDIQGGGLGAGEGAKDVSDQIESEDQLEDTKQAGDKGDEDNADDDPDVKEEKEGIEMNNDFDSKLQDLELDGNGDSDDDDDDKEDEEDEADPDKQMGDVDGEDETLDEKMWGDEDEEDDEKDNTDKKEEKGEGAEGKSESEIVAKEENEGEQEGDNNKKRKRKKKTSTN